MLAAVNRFIVDCSHTWWKVLLLFLGQTATMRVLSTITERFPAMTAGDVPFDMQNSLTTDQIFTQLAGYSEQAFSHYYVFQAVDFAFPLLAGLFLASLCAFGLRHASPAWYQAVNSRNLFTLILLATLFDYLENINLLWVVSSWPEPASFAAQLGVLAKKAKLTFLVLSFAVTGLCPLGAAGRWAGVKTGLLSD